MKHPWLRHVLSLNLDSLASHIVQRQCDLVDLFSSPTTLRSVLNSSKQFVGQDSLVGVDLRPRLYSRCWVENHPFWHSFSIQSNHGSIHTRIRLGRFRYLAHRSVRGAFTVPWTFIVEHCLGVSSQLEFLFGSNLAPSGTFTGPSGTSGSEITGIHPISGSSSSSSAPLFHLLLSSAHSSISSLSGSRGFRLVQCQFKPFLSQLKCNPYQSFDLQVAIQCNTPFLVTLTFYLSDSYGSWRECASATLSYGILNSDLADLLQSVVIPPHASSPWINGINDENQLEYLAQAYKQHQLAQSNRRSNSQMFSTLDSLNFGTKTAPVVFGEKSRREAYSKWFSSFSERLYPIADIPNVDGSSSSTGK